MDTLHLAEETETDNKDDYRPAFMDHFDRADDRAKTAMKGNDATESSPARQTAVAGAAASPQKDWKRSHTDFDYVRIERAVASFCVVLVFSLIVLLVEDPVS